MLYGSVKAEKEAAARTMLEAWTERVSEGRKPEDRLPLSLEIALAQGFKQAANRRPRHPHARRDSRGYLAERALECWRGRTSGSRD